MNSNIVELIQDTQSTILCPFRVNEVIYIKEDRQYQESYYSECYYNKCPYYDAKENSCYRTYYET